MNTSHKAHSAPRWHAVECGSGRPLILLHGIGMSHAAWEPVMQYLAQERRVIALDLPGFGQTPPLASGIGRDCASLALELGKELWRRGIKSGEADVAGNSLGGLIALHAAADGLARSVVGLSPTGLWHQHGPRHTVPMLQLMHLGGRLLPGISDRLMRSSFARRLLLTVPVTSSGRMPESAAVRANQDFAEARDFQATLKAVVPFRRGAEIQVPCTVAFGNRDFLLSRLAQKRDLLPPSVRWLKRSGWGHVPMWDDPAGVTHLILEGSS